jgi:hypothetical protein
LKIIKRTKNTKFLYFFHKNSLKKEPYKKFLKEQKIHDLIKLTSEEFKTVLKKKVFFHFNLQHSVHKKNKKYYLVKILKHGYSDKKKYIHPILSSEFFLLTKCESSRNFINYTQIKKNELNKSLLLIKSIKNLKLSILKKYKKSLSHIDNNTKIKMGVSITKLKILKKIKL